MATIISDSNGRSFLVSEYIDKGSFSKVYSLKCTSTEQIYAGKFINRAKMEMYNITVRVYDEIKIHRQLRHANIVQYLTYIKLPSYIVIVLEYCSKYSMVNVLHCLKRLAVLEAKYYMVQLVSAVEYLHSNHVVHRDLKLGNMFVNRQLEMKLGDFGLAVVIEYDGQRRFSRCGTPNYIAPEVIQKIGHSYEVDIWALGCILYTMLEGTPPFQGETTATTYNNILKCELRLSPNMHEDAKEFITSSIKTDPKCRPSVFDLAKLKFLSSREHRLEPPKLKFVEDNLVLENTNRIHDEIINSKPRTSANNIVYESNISGNPYKWLVKLSKMLANVSNWEQSDVGEFLSENVSVKPVLWVNSWMDYTNSYGFGYQLSNKNVGLLFNDQTRMLYQAETKTVYYTDDHGTTVHYRVDNVPNGHKKKLKVLLSCGKYMSESLSKAHECRLTSVSGRTTNETTEVFRWTRKSQSEIVMFLTDGCVQANFISDHVKFILCGQTKTVTMIKRADCMKTFKIDSLQTLGCSRYVKQKVGTVLTFINNLLAERKRFL